MLFYRLIFQFLRARFQNGTTTAIYRWAAELTKQKIAFFRKISDFWTLLIIVYRSWNTVLSKKWYYSSYKVLKSEINKIAFYGQWNTITA